MSKFLAAVAAVAALAAATPAFAQNPSFAPVIKRVSPAVVNIGVRGTVAAPRNPFFDDPGFRRFFGLPPDAAPREREFRSAGSGVIVDADGGFIVTNAHVIKNASEITITLVDDIELKAEVVGADDRSDVAVLKVTEGKLPAEIALADSSKLQVGDFVIAIGNPFGLQHTVTSGIVSALGRSGINRDNLEDFIQTDAAINPGNSGGALVSLDGELVGINSVILSSQGGGNIGIGFAIPSNMVRSIMEQLIEHGEVNRGQLGVVTISLSPEFRQSLGLPENTQGALVTQVAEGSAAARAGIVVSDVITSVRGQAIRTNSELRNAIGMLKVGESVAIGLLRDGKPRTVTAVLREPAQLADAVGDPPGAGWGGARRSDRRRAAACGCARCSPAARRLRWASCPRTASSRSIARASRASRSCAKRRKARRRCCCSWAAATRCCCCRCADFRPCRPGPYNRAMARRSVCVLGGSGFVGTQLCAALATAGWLITVPTRNPDRARHLTLLPTLALVAADVHDGDRLAVLCSRQDAVVNLIGILNERGRDGSGFEHAHVALARTLVAACRRQRVPRLLQMSALNADADRGPSHYLRSKGRAERVIREECGPDLLWTIFQPSVIFGPRDDFANRFARLLRVLPLALPLARPGARFAPVWVEDVVAAFMRALADDATAGECYELAGPEILHAPRDRHDGAGPSRPPARDHRPAGFRSARAGGGLRFLAGQTVLHRQLSFAARRQRRPHRRLRAPRHPAAAVQRRPAALSRIAAAITSAGRSARARAHRARAPSSTRRTPAVRCRGV